MYAIRLEVVAEPAVLDSDSTILKEQDDRSKSADRAMVDNLHFVKDLAQRSQSALENGNLREFARLMDVHWQRKKARSVGMSKGQSQRNCSP